MPPMTGRVIAGRYDLAEPIGRGAMGVVWRARDLLLDRDVAVKEVVLNAAIGEDERQNAYQRTLREARTAARLSHRGVVTVYDVVEEDGRPWIVMELVPSRSLDQILADDGPVTPRRAGRIGQQLLSALAAAHAAGVLHRDVKPSNVLIAKETMGTERAVLTDFGIAQFEGDPRLTQTGMVMGSPGFTAPERIRGGSATPASDLWSLGATIYAAVEGQGPYEQRGGAITTMTAIINEDAPAAPSSGRLAPVIAALLRREPSARPSAMAAARMFAEVLPYLPDQRFGRTRRAPAAAPTWLPARQRASVPAVPTAKDIASGSATAGARAPGPENAPSADTAPETTSPEVADSETATGEPAAEEQTARGPATQDDVTGNDTTTHETTTHETTTYETTTYETTTHEATTHEAIESVETSDDATESVEPAEDTVEETPAKERQSAEEHPAMKEPAAAREPAKGAAASAEPLPSEETVPNTPVAAMLRDELRGHDESAWTVRDSRGVPRQAEPSFSAARPAVPPTRPQAPYDHPTGQAANGPGRRGRIAALGVIAAVAAAAAIVAVFLLSRHTPAPRQQRSGTGTGTVSTTGAGNSPAPVRAVDHPVPALPQGWETETVSPSLKGTEAGFSIGLPASWTIQQNRLATDLIAPDQVRYMDVDLTPHKYANMVAEANYIAVRARAEGHLPGYKQIAIRPVTIRGARGAFWAFTWQTSSGVTMRVDDLLFSLDGQSYALYFTTPVSEFNSAEGLPLFEKMLGTFHVVRS